MAFDEARAKLLAENAFDHLKKTGPEALEWARNIGASTFRNLRLKTFLWHYCWVVYASGFKFSVIEDKFPSIKNAFKNFEPASLARMRSIKPVLSIFDNERKAKSFLTGAQSVIDEGFASFKNRLRNEGIDVLEKLPGIGPITKYHLAKNIGLVDVSKPDIWLERAAILCGAPTVQHLTEYAAQSLAETQHVVDVAIWKYGKDGLFPKY
jgi:hypothetical protein